VSCHNFSAGPAMLPVEVRRRLSEDLAVSADGLPSIAEVSHRGPRFAALAEELRHRLKQLMGLGSEHEVLLLHGGANLQFAMVAMNLAAHRPPAYLVSGHWSLKALAEARRIGPVAVVGSSQEGGFRDLPVLGPLPDACAYLHYCGNETIHGVQFRRPPRAAVPVIADLSSEFLSRPYPYGELALAYAGAQKNLGLTGLTVVSIRRSLLDLIPDNLPRFLDYRSWVASDSMYNTPVTLAWYAALEVCRWIDQVGGLAVLAERNRRRAKRLYAAIDASDFWSNPVAAAARSVMNVPFFPPESDRADHVIASAEQAGLLGLKGHRALGGLRASLYNALDEDAVETLIEFLGDYERRFG